MKSIADLQRGINTEKNLLFGREQVLFMKKESFQAQISEAESVEELTQELSKLSKSDLESIDIVEEVLGVLPSSSNPKDQKEALFYAKEKLNLSKNQIEEITGKINSIINSVRKQSRQAIESVQTTDTNYPNEEESEEEIKNKIDKLISYSGSDIQKLFSRLLPMMKSGSIELQHAHEAISIVLKKDRDSIINEDLELIYDFLSQNIATSLESHFSSIQLLKEIYFVEHSRENETKTSLSHLSDQVKYTNSNFNLYLDSEELSKDKKTSYSIDMYATQVVANLLIEDYEYIETAERQLDENSSSEVNQENFDKLARLYNELAKLISSHKFPQEKIFDLRENLKFIDSLLEKQIAMAENTYEKAVSSKSPHIMLKYADNAQDLYEIAKQYEREISILILEKISKDLSINKNCLESLFYYLSCSFVSDNPAVKKATIKLQTEIVNEILSFKRKLDNIGKTGDFWSSVFRILKNVENEHASLIMNLLKKMYRNQDENYLSKIIAEEGDSKYACEIIADYSENSIETINNTIKNIKFGDRAINKLIKKALSHPECTLESCELMLSKIPDPHFLTSEIFKVVEQKLIEQTNQSLPDGILIYSREDIERKALEIKNFERQFKVPENRHDPELLNGFFIFREELIQAWQNLESSLDTFIRNARGFIKKIKRKDIKIALSEFLASYGIKVSQWIKAIDILGPRITGRQITKKIIKQTKDKVKSTISNYKELHTGLSENQFSSATA